MSDDLPIPCSHFHLLARSQSSSSFHVSLARHFHLVFSRHLSFSMAYPSSSPSSVCVRRRSSSHTRTSSFISPCYVTTLVDSLLFSFLILSLGVTPHIHCIILISFTSIHVFMSFRYSRRFCPVLHHWHAICYGRFKQYARDVWGLCKTMMSIFYDTKRSLISIIAFCALLQSEKMTIDVPRVDGDSVRVWVRATDVMGNTKIDDVLVHVDSSPPVIQDVSLSRHGRTQLAVHNSVDLFDAKWAANTACLFLYFR